jgi:hypothetical protein
MAMFEVALWCHRSSLWPECLADVEAPTGGIAMAFLMAQCGCWYVVHAAAREHGKTTIVRGHGLRVTPEEATDFDASLVALFAADGLTVAGVPQVNRTPANTLPVSDGFFL